MGILMGQDGLPIGKKTDGSKFRILVVDDSQFILKQISQIFTSRDFEVVGMATDGKQGLELYQEHKDNIDLVTLDITMPEMDGLETLKRIMEFDPDASVIMVTALGTAEAVKEAIKFGAKGYIVKPLDRNKVLERVAQILQ